MKYCLIDAAQQDIREIVNYIRTVRSQSIRLEAKRNDAIGSATAG